VDPPGRPCGNPYPGSDTGDLGQTVPGWQEHSRTTGFPGAPGQHDQSAVGAGVTQPPDIRLRHGGFRVEGHGLDRRRRAKVLVGSGLDHLEIRWRGGDPQLVESHGHQRKPGVHSEPGGLERGVHRGCRAEVFQAGLATTPDERGHQVRHVRGRRLGAVVGDRVVAIRVVAVGVETDQSFGDRHSGVRRTATYPERRRGRL
jgi:hypothetical protein